MYETGPRYRLSRLLVSPLFIPKFCSQGRSSRLRHATGLFTLDGIRLYDHVHALLAMSIKRLHVFAMQEDD
jgi:hypothetical protein